MAKRELELRRGDAILKISIEGVPDAVAVRALRHPLVEQITDKFQSCTLIEETSRELERDPKARAYLLKNEQNLIEFFQANSDVGNIYSEMILLAIRETSLLVISEGLQEFGFEKGTADTLAGAIKNIADSTPGESKGRKIVEEIIRVEQTLIV